MSEPLTAEVLLRLASTPADRVRLVAFGELVESGLVEIADIGPLREAGLKFWEIEDAPSTAPRVWVEPAEFVRAAAIVAQLRNEAERGVVH